MDVEAQVEHKQYSTIPAIKFAVSSIAMILINKSIATMFPFMAFVLLFQNLGTIALLKIWKPELTLKTQIAWRWLPCVLLFCTNIYTSLQALSLVSIPTFTVCRNMQPIITTILDFIFRHEISSQSNVFFLVVILFGAYIYAYNNIFFHLTGYLWTMAHVLSMSFYTIIVKRTINNYNMDSFEMSWYNNTMSLVVFVIIFLYELNTFQYPDTNAEQIIGNCTRQVPCWSMIMLSAFGGFSVSLAGFQAQKAMSPTSWLTCNNISKIPAIILSSILWGTELSEMEIIGISISLLGGYMYALSANGLLTHS